MDKLEAILFDLDDTLLRNDMNVFLASYFPLLAEYMQPRIDNEQFLSELMTGTQAMISNQDRTLTNREVFWSVFSERTGLGQNFMEPFFDEFYRERFCDLESITRRLPVARLVIQECFDAGLKVVIATNPLFPLRAIEHRLSWADLPVNEFDYAMVTAYENMHATKPNTAYYQEILTEIGVGPERAMMIGDDWENDIIPADQLGLYTFWIDNINSLPPDDNTSLNGQGTLEVFHARLQTEWLNNQSYPLS